MRGFLGLLFFLFACLQSCFLASALQRADFDIYPALVSSNENERESGKAIGQTILRVGNAVGLGGCVFLGYRFARSLLKRDRYNNNNVDEFNEQLLSSNSTVVIEELKKEQEELWRVVHSLFKSQEDKLVALEAALKDRSVSTADEQSTSMKELEAVVETMSGKLTSRIDTIESQLQAVEQSTDSARKETKHALEEEVKGLNTALEALRSDIKAQMLKWLREHDDAVVEKIRLFGEDIKRLMKSSPSSPKSKHSSSSSPSKP